MRWPFGPPPLTLKPSPKNKNKTKEVTPPKKRRTKNNTKTNKYQKKSFAVINQNFLSFLFWPEKPFFDNLAQNARTPPKHYKNGVSENQFWKKQLCVTKRPFLDPPKNLIQKFQLSFLGCPFLLFQKKTQKCSETPFFVLWQTQKDNFKI